MKTRMLSMVSLTAMVVALAGGPVRAQSARLVVANIPFNFCVKDKTLPAGEYTVEPIQVGGSEALRIQSADGHVTAIVPVRSARAKATQVEPRLVFQRSGDQYVLAQVLGLEATAIHTLPKSHREDELAKDGSALKRNAVSVTGQHR